MKAVRASVEVGISLEHTYRLKRKYKLERKQGFIHKNAEKTPSNKFSDQFENQILDLVKNKYFDFNFKHLNEKLKERHHINISYTKCISLLNKNNIYSKRNKENNIVNITSKIETPIDHFPHPRLPRKKYFGEQIQMDASRDVYFGKEKVTLHPAIDNATKRVVWAYFDKEETLQGYYHVMAQILSSYGIHYEILTDRRTIFEYTKIKAPKLYEDAFTNFSYAMQNLGVLLTCSSIQQAKGQIERAFCYWHDRFPPEARLANINNIQEANPLLQQVVKEYNSQLGYP